MEDFSRLKEWLSEKLRAKGWSMDDLAEATKLNRSTLFHYYTDRSRPTVDSMKKICEALGAELADGLAQFSARSTGRRKAAVSEILA